MSLGAKLQVFRQQEQEGTALIGAGLRIMLLSVESGSLAEGLTRLGGQVDQQGETYAALSAILDDPSDCGLFVMNCDGLGGLAAGRHAIAMLSLLKQPLPSILVSQDCSTQVFPEGPREPVVLRAPPSALSLRRGLEHALRARLMWLHA